MAAGLQPVDVAHAGQARVLGQAAQQEHVGRLVPGQQLARLGDPAVDHVGRGLRPRAPAASSGSGASPVACGSVSVRRRRGPAPRKTTTKRCSFTGSTKTSHAGHVDLPQQLGSSSADFSVAMRPARRSVIRPAASTVQKLPRAATSSGCSVEADAERLQHAAADLVRERVVAEEGQVRRPAARGDAGGDGLAEAADGVRPGRRGWAWRRSPARSCRRASGAARPGRP